MFERFNGDARQVVVLAEQEARRLQHNYIGTEHLLLGLVKLPDPAAVPRALSALGITADTVDTAIRQIIGPGQEPLPSKIPFTPRSKKVLELSLREALAQQLDYIGPEHVLLGLLREGGGVAAQILTQNGRSLDQIRAAAMGAVPSAASLPRSRTPALQQALLAAQQSAAGAPLGTHHLLEALARGNDSMAGKTLAALGVTTDAILAQTDRLDIAETTDITPEQAAASTLRWETDDEGVRIRTSDPETVATLRRLIDQAGGTLTGDGPLAGPFIGLHQAIRAAAAGIDSALNPAGDAQAAPSTLRERLRRRSRGAR